MSFKERFGISFTALISVVFGVFMAILDTSIVNVAIPKMMSVFVASQNQIQWVVTAYLLVTGMITPAAGYLGDRFGQKRIYLFALAVFTIGSALCGLAWSTESLVAFRVFQAVGGAMLMPVSMTILFSMSPPEKRGIIMGIWGIALMFAPALGPTLSGYLVEYLNFRLIFYINVPIGILSFFMVSATIPAMPSRPTEKLDLAGMLTSLIGFFSLLYALSEAPTDGWHSVTIITFLAVAAVSLAMFVVVELTAENPMLDLRLLGRRVYLISALATSLISVTMLGGLFILPVFLQDALKFTPLQTGLLTLPGALVTAVLMPVSGALYDRIGARVPGILGMAVLFGTSIVFMDLNVNWGYSTIMALYMFRQAGMGLSMMPLGTAGINDVPQRSISRATALQNTMRNVSASIGTAYLSTIMQTSSSADFVTYTQRLSVANLQGFSLGQSAPSVYGVTSQGGMNQLVTLLQGLAFEKGTDAAFVAAAGFALLSLILVFFVGKKRIAAGAGAPDHAHGKRGEPGVAFAE